MSGILDTPNRVQHACPESELSTLERRARLHLIAHRGLWLQPIEKNSVAAFDAALSHGFGIETDVRDLGSKLVISHDIPNDHCQTLEAFLEQYHRSGANTTLAINVKSDGLAQELNHWLNQFSIRNYFVFDMSVPDSLHYAKLGMTLYARRSEYEPESSQLDLAQGVWLDGFHGEWFTANDWEKYLSQGKGVAIVSPELHKRPHQSFWNQLELWLRSDLRGTHTASGTQSASGLMLCTDFPREFKEILCR